VVIGALLVVGVVTWEASEGLMHPGVSADCATPEALGIGYEAVGYQRADDDHLQPTPYPTPPASADPLKAICPDRRQSPDGTLVSRDGTRLDGWYIPAAPGADATWTVLLVHGWTADKSAMLPYVRELHDRYDVAVVDLRDAGRSDKALVTAGVREQSDVRAMVDWLETNKHPAHIALMGVSMGGATSALEAATDERIDALILDSTHAHAEDAISAILWNDHLVPGALAGLVEYVASVRLGLDIRRADPARTIPALGHRPLLIIHGGSDTTDRPWLSAEMNLATARSAGVPVAIHTCAGADHGHDVDVCPGQWGAWVADFLDHPPSPAPVFPPTPEPSPG
jgi:pimeloyl-ACP methyl ester carboxylesterase